MNTTHTTAPAETAPAPHMTELRSHLMATLASLRDRTRPMEPDRARAVAQVAAVLVDSARVEVDYARLAQKHKAQFFDTPPAARPGGTAGATSAITATSQPEPTTRNTATGTLQQLPGGRSVHRIRDDDGSED